MNLGVIGELVPNNAVIRLLQGERCCRWRDLKKIARTHGVNAYWASKKLRRIGVIRGKRGLCELK